MDKLFPTAKTALPGEKDYIESGMSELQAQPGATSEVSVTHEGEA